MTGMHGYAQAGHQQVYHILRSAWVSPDHPKSDPFFPRAYRFLADSPNYALCTNRKGEPRKVSRPAGEPGPNANVCPECLRIFTEPQPEQEPAPDTSWEILGGETILRWHGQIVKGAWEATSPQEAEKLLAVNKANRKLRPGRVNSLVRDMENGDFVPNGATVVVYDDDDGESTEALGDAQHRLTAISVSGTTQPMLVVRGVRRDWLITVDQNITRSFLDAQRVAGIADVSVRVGRVARRMLLWDRGLHVIPGGGMTKNPPSTTEIQGYYESHREEIDASIEDVYRRSRACHVNEVVFSTSQILLTRQDPELAEEFMTALWTGAGLKEGDPVLALREYFNWHASENKFRGDVERQRSYVLKAWNDRLSGRTVLRYKRNSVSGDPARYLKV